MFGRKGDFLMIVLSAIIKTRYDDDGVFPPRPMQRDDRIHPPRTKHDDIHRSMMTIIFTITPKKHSRVKVRGSEKW